jgi:hypothetical protein
VVLLSSIGTSENSVDYHLVSKVSEALWERGRCLETPFPNAYPMAIAPVLSCNGLAEGNRVSADQTAFPKRFANFGNEEKNNSGIRSYRPGEAELRTR